MERGCRNPPFALTQMAQIMHQFQQYRRNHVTAFGMTVPQFNALLQLDRYGELNPSQLARLLFSDRPTVTVIAKNLEKCGWVKRTRSESNRKYVALKITPHGRAKLRELSEAEESQTGNFELLQCYSDSELSQLEDLLDKLILHFRDLPEIERVG